MGIIFINKSEASKFLDKLSDEFVLIENPDFVHPEYEIIPLAKKVYHPEKLIAAVMDMDGTTTTTEELCIESLEFMIRKMSGLISNEQWNGLDENDYPNIIGNSTTKHIEYLINKYFHLIDKEIAIKSFVEAIRWTLVIGKSEQRKKEVQELLKSFGFGEEDLSLISMNDESLEQSYDFTKIKNLITSKINLDDFSNLVKIGIEIYYYHYHQYLINLSENYNLTSSKKLIEPLPGVAIFLSLIKGLLGDEAENLTEKLIDDFKRKNPETKESFQIEKVKVILKNLGIYFEKNPLKIAVVTSSIFYEAHIVLSEVFNQMKSEILSWDITDERKLKIIEKFSSYQNFYDVVVTATDAYEFRLKPHRDLYSIALYRLGISKDDFDKVVGFEDSQSGTIAIRAAGIGCCIAVPFPKSRTHNLNAASYILLNGLPEFILKHNCLIN